MAEWLLWEMRRPKHYVLIDSTLSLRWGRLKSSCERHQIFIRYSIWVETFFRFLARIWGDEGRASYGNYINSRLSAREGREGRRQEWGAKEGGEGELKASSALRMAVAV